MVKDQMVLALIFALTALAPVSESQASTWARTYGGIALDWPTNHGTSIQQTTDGGYVVLGYTESFGGNVPLWVLKLNAVGTVTWQKVYPNAMSQFVGSIQEKTGGGYVLTGRFGPSVNQSRIWVMTLDPGGNISWQNSFGGPVGDEGVSVKVVSSGYLIAGSTGGGLSDYYVSKLDPSGSIIWQNTYGGGQHSEFGRSIFETSSGDYLVGGYTDNFGSYDPWLLKLDPSNGNPIWQKTYGTSASEILWSAQEAAGGTFIVSGSQANPSGSGHAAWVLNLDNSGNIVWQKSYAGGNYEEAHHAQQTADGGYIFVGETDSFGAGDEDVLVVKLDALGNISWQKTYGGTDYDEGFYIQQTTDGGYVLTAGTLSFGAGAEDLWILKLDENGNIDDPACPVGTSSLTVTNTSAVMTNLGSAPQIPPFIPVPTNVTPIPTIAAVNTTCGPPTIAQGSGYCIQGISTGTDYSWFIDLDGDGIIDITPPEPFESSVTGIPSGQNAAALAIAFVTSINNNSISLAANVSAAITSPGCFTIQADPRCYGGTSPGAPCTLNAHCPGGGVCIHPIPMLYVGPPGNPTSCKVSPNGCSYNPMIFQVSPTSGVNSNPESKVRLGQNAPNPFVPKTKIPFTVMEHSHVIVEVFDVAGRRLRVLANEAYEPGEWAVDWDGRDESGVRLPAGTYFYRLVMNGKAMARKMILLP